MKKNTKRTSKKTKNNKANKNLIILIAVLAVVLVAAVILLIVKLTDKDAVSGPSVAISQDYSHPIPQDLETDGSITMKSDEGFLDILITAGGYTAGAEPLYYYDESGEAAGQYLYDENGWVYAWKADDGTVHDLPEDEQFVSPFMLLGGEPLLMTGDVKLHFIVYTKDQTAVTTYMYYILSEKSDMDTFQTAMSRSGLGSVEKVSDTVAVATMDATAINEEMTRLNQEYVLTDYLSWLGETYGVAR